MVGISSMLRLVTLAIVAIGMSHAATVAVAEKAESPDPSLPQGGDAVGYGSKAGSVSAIAEKVESSSVTLDNGDYGCGTLLYPHSCWRYCAYGAGWCYTKPSVTCQQDQDCSGYPPCSSTCGP